MAPIDKKDKGELLEIVWPHTKKRMININALTSKMI